MDVPYDAEVAVLDGGQAGVVVKSIPNPNSAEASQLQLIFQLNFNRSLTFIIASCLSNPVHFGSIFAGFINGGLHPIVLLNIVFYLSDFDWKPWSRRRQRFEMMQRAGRTQ
jgi:hypothetical protein